MKFIPLYAALGIVILALLIGISLGFVIAMAFPTDNKEDGK